ncbi:hypothetical protein KXW98_001685 [Aspergillus fumigatus]|uniref:CBF1-interacting co-repressor CIR N-terminal domain-containing protein n=1 Tax=Aspergillus fumigatus TaxID=746128 RepID=A0A229WS49_ASPFM|nr:hypothetical protein CNMCM8714_005367 [Aspergillus fumigatus]KAF4272689.1 hypothetical protein CNMCM8057_005957 [Aspergillus fumigatus]KAF4276105.1 hypothetical protein CNMCM8812_005314 [Aspergillus fumigatus]KAF4285510.1 hypothetical protein CNMCM8689_004604 [Aspergillus fumigatus]KAF4295663.1 hypothetical protein CNMCM8686_007193 [Aspergillus fumigatus]
MPLHLLGKKSWNVYNPENIARVRRDEAEAKAREEEEERRMQEIDAERRIQILRGEQHSTPPPPPSALSDTRRDRTHGEDAGRYRKRRRLAGENDTDRDIRLAREDAQLMMAKKEELAVSKKTSDAPLLDSKGHINLFPSEAAQQPVEKNKEAEKEAADRNRSYEDQYTMRFSNAAGYRQSAGQMPWYSSSSRDALAPDAMPEKDVWGNEDPMRQEREKARLDANDPLMAIKRGVRQLKIGNTGAHTDIARIAVKEVAAVLAIIFANNPGSDTVTPIPTPIRTVIVITMIEGAFARCSRPDAMCNTCRYGTLILM